MVYQYTCPVCKKFFRTDASMDWVTCICCGANWYVNRAGGRTRVRDFRRYPAMTDTYSLLFRILASAMMSGGVLYWGVSGGSVKLIILAFVTFACATICAFRI